LNEFIFFDTHFYTNNGTNFNDQPDTAIELFSPIPVKPSNVDAVVWHRFVRPLGLFNFHCHHPDNGAAVISTAGDFGCGDWDGFISNGVWLLLGKVCKRRLLPQFVWLPLTVLKRGDYAGPSFSFFIFAEILFLWLTPVTAAKPAAVFYGSLAIFSADVSLPN